MDVGPHQCPLWQQPRRSPSDGAAQLQHRRHQTHCAEHGLSQRRRRRRRRPRRAAIARAARGGESGGSQRAPLPRTWWPAAQATARWPRLCPASRSTPAPSQPAQGRPERLLTNLHSCRRSVGALSPAAAAAARRLAAESAAGRGARAGDDASADEDDCSSPVSHASSCSEGRSQQGKPIHKKRTIGSSNRRGCDVPGSCYCNDVWFCCLCRMPPLQLTASVVFE